MEDVGNFKCSLCENQYSYKGTLKTHIMIKHCKCLSFDCNQCRQHLAQSLNRGCEKQQALRSDKEEGFERLPDIPHQSESFKNTPLPNGIHSCFNQNIQAQKQKFETDDTEGPNEEVALWKGIWTSYSKAHLPIENGADEGNLAKSPGEGEWASPGKVGSQWTIGPKTQRRQIQK